MMFFFQIDGDWFLDDYRFLLDHFNWYVNRLGHRYWDRFVDGHDVWLGNVDWNMHWVWFGNWHFLVHWYNVRFGNSDHLGNGVRLWNWNFFMDVDDFWNWNLLVNVFDYWNYVWDWIGFGHRYVLDNRHGFRNVYWFWYRHMVWYGD